MDNLEHLETIEDRTAQVEYRIYSHVPLSQADLYRLMSKKSLYEPIGTAIRYNRTYQIVKIIAADGWEDAE